MAPKKNAPQAEDAGATLHKLIKKGDSEAVKVFMQDQPATVLAAESKNGLTPLGAAVEKGDDMMADTLLKLGAEVDGTGRGCSGQTPFLISCWGNDDVCARLLLQAGANPNTADTMGRTALHAICATGAVPLLEFLLEPDVEAAHPFDLNKTVARCDKHGMNVLHFLAAEVHSSSKMAEIFDLITTKANPATLKACLQMEATSKKATPLHLLLSGASEEDSGHLGRLKRCIELGAPLQATDDEGAIPLCAALERGHSRTVALLVQQMRAEGSLARATKETDKAGNCLAIYALRSDNPASFLAEFLKVCPEFDVAPFSEDLLDAAVDLQSEEAFKILASHVGSETNPLTYRERCEAKVPPAPAPAAEKAISRPGGDFTGTGAPSTQIPRGTASKDRGVSNGPTLFVIAAILVLVVAFGAAVVLK